MNTINRINAVKKRIGFSISVLLLLLLAASCGQNPSDKAKAAQVIKLPDALQTIVHPDLTGLEPLALQQVEAQKQALDQLAANPEADPNLLGAAYGKMGMLYFSFSFRPAAEVCLLNAVFQAPRNFQWYYYLGNLYKEMNEPEKSLFYLEKAHEMKGDSAPVKINLAEALRIANQPERAKTLFEESIALDAKSANAYLGLGHLAATAGNHAEAIQFFGQVLATQARSSTVHYPMALSYQALGKDEEAAKHMNLRGEVEPYLDDPFMAQIYKPRAETHYRMAETLRLAEKNQEAVVHYDLVVRLDPTNPGPRMGRALNLVRLGHHFEAVVRIQDDLTVFPNMVVMHHILARLWATSPDDRVRDGKKALLLLDSLKKTGITAELTETLGMAFASVGRFDDAILAQNKAIELARESGDEAFVKKLEAGVKRYKENKAVDSPWPDDDPIFKLLTYRK